MQILAVRSLTEVLVSLVTNIFIIVFLVGIHIYVVIGAFRLLKFLFYRISEGGSKKTQLEGGFMEFWFGWILYFILLFCYMVAGRN